MLTNKIVLMGLVGLCIFVFNDNAVASDFRWSAGVMQWYSNLEYENPEGEKSDDDSVFMGPEIKFQKENYFGELNLLFGLRDSNIDDGDRKEPDNQINWDLDVILGYMVHPRFDIHSGFKRIDLDYYEVYFGMIGASFNIPIQAISFICSAEYFPLGEINEPKNIHKVDGWSADAGLAYNFSHHGFYCGYKYEIINVKDNALDNERDSILNGITLSYKYNF